MYINTLTSSYDNIYVARQSKNESVRKEGREDMRTKGGGLACWKNQWQRSAEKQGGSVENTASLSSFLLLYLSTPIRDQGTHPESCLPSIWSDVKIMWVSLHRRWQGWVSRQTCFFVREVKTPIWLWLLCVVWFISYIAILITPSLYVSTNMLLWVQHKCTHWQFGLLNQKRLR